jgi:hypothetical protein
MRIQAISRRKTIFGYDAGRGVYVSGKIIGRLIIFNFTISIGAGRIEKRGPNGAKIIQRNVPMKKESGEHALQALSLTGRINVDLVKDGAESFPKYLLDTMDC